MIAKQGEALQQQREDMKKMQAQIDAILEGE